MTNVAGECVVMFKHKKIVEKFGKDFPTISYTSNSLMVGLHHAATADSRKNSWEGGVCHIGVPTFVASTSNERPKHSLPWIYAADNMLILACCIVENLMSF